MLGPYAEAHGFLLMRKDYEMFKNDPFKKRILDMVAPAVQGFRLHPKLREVLNGMWTEFEAALTGSDGRQVRAPSGRGQGGSILARRSRRGPRWHSPRGGLAAQATTETTAS